MSTPQQPGGFYSTPGFKLYERGLIVQTIAPFRGINAFTPLNQLKADQAQDCLNVIVGSSGLLGKMRLPTQISANRLDSFWDFQQGVGVHQVVFHNSETISYLDVNNAYAKTDINTDALNSSAWNFVIANNILFGANGQHAMKWTGTDWQNWGIAASSGPPTIGAISAGTLTAATGYTYKYAYMNTVTGHVGNASDASTETGALADQKVQVNAAASTDSQVDAIVWFRVLDGGGDWYKLCQIPYSTGAPDINNGTIAVSNSGLTIEDETPDSGLDLTTVAPLNNGLPPVGTFLALGQGRIFITGVANAPSTVYYSGYEQILLGRPEESFPQYNQVLLDIGAQKVNGIGVMQIGLVFFSDLDRVYFLRGQIEDITLSQPINFSETLEELPWKFGAFCHNSIQSTPLGIVWLASDKTVQFWNGRGDPQDISQNIYPQLRSITPGTEGSTSGAYFNWLERDWYALTCAISGSIAPNRIFFFATNADTSQIDIFVSDVQASWMGVIDDGTKQRKLCIAQNTQFASLPVSATDIGGIVQNEFRTAATNGYMKAYWRSGYFGIDQPQRSKMWRWMRLITDQDPRSYRVQHRFTDDVLFTLATPRLVGPAKLTGTRQGLGIRGNRYCCEIQFPDEDTDMNVLELQVANIATSDR